MASFSIPAVVLRLKRLLGRLPSARVQVMPKGVVIFNGKYILARIPWNTGASESFSFPAEPILNDSSKANKESLRVWNSIKGNLDGNKIFLEWASQSLNNGQPIPAEPTIPVEKVLCGEPGARVVVSYFVLCELAEMIEALTFLNPKDRERAAVVIEPIQGAPRAYFAILIDSLKGKIVDGVFSFWNPNFGAPSLKNAEQWEEKTPSVSGKEG